jgi:hypothetical protein
MIRIPNSISVPYTPLAGGYTSGFPARHVNHTTETSGLPQYSGSNPHATVDVKRRKIYFHQDLGSPCKALRGSEFAGIETNRAHAIQTEFIGYSSLSLAQSINRGDLWVGNWNDNDWAFIAGYARVIHHLTGVPLHGIGDYRDSAHPMSNSDWQDFSGFCGHQHVPGQDHWDPSSKWREDLVLDGGSSNWDGAYPGLPVELRDRGSDVKKVQRWLNILAPNNLIKEDGAFGKSTGRRVRHFQHHHGLDADGIVGPITWRALREAAHNKKEKA